MGRLPVASHYQQGLLTASAYTGGRAEVGRPGEQEQLGFQLFLVFRPRLKTFMIGRNKKKNGTKSHSC